MITAIIAVLAILAYFLIGGFAYKLAGGGTTDAAVGVGMLWPLVPPALFVGAVVGLGASLATRFIAFRRRRAGGVYKAFPPDIAPGTTIWYEGQKGTLVKRGLSSYFLLLDSGHLSDWLSDYEKVFTTEPPAEEPPQSQ